MSVSTESLRFSRIRPQQQLGLNVPAHRFRPVNPTIGVIIPTLNEEKNLHHVLPLIPPWVHELILVDGRSTDRTVEVAKELRPDIRIIEEKRPGKGVALRSGMAAATADILVLIDADGSTDPAEIPVFVGALMSGADFVKGSRFLQGGGTADMELYRQWGNRGLMWLVRLLFGGQYSDLCYGYNALWRSCLADLDLDCDGFEIETLMNIRALKAKLVIAEVPSFEASRIHGTSNLNSIKDGLRILRTIFSEFFRTGKGRSRKQAAQHHANHEIQIANVPFSTAMSTDVCPTCAKAWSMD